MTVNCSPCTSGCTYIWENRSYDASGSPETTQKGTGTTSDTVTIRTTLASNCAGETAVGGVSAGGVQKSYSLHCDCP